jgi:hypothetical protein
MEAISAATSRDDRHCGSAPIGRCLRCGAGFNPPKPAPTNGAHFPSRSLNLLGLFFAALGTLTDQPHCMSQYGAVGGSVHAS